MKRPVLPAEELLNKSTSEAMPRSAEPSKRRPKLVLYRGIPTHRPDDINKQSIPVAEPQPYTDTAAEGPDPAVPGSVYALPPSAAPETPTQAGNQPMASIGKSDEENQSGSSPEKNPGRRLHDFEAAAKNSPRTKIPWQYRIRPTRERTHRAYWDVTGTLSLIINIILIAILVIMAQQIKNLKTTVNSLNNIANNVLGGLYGSFVQMDQATINTTINVDTQIPLNFTLPVTENTQVVLSQDVSVTGAHVVINTGVLNINAPANFTLPAGTSLPITLKMDIPVQTSIPISLQVPVNIPLSQTGLHQPFTSLQASLRPIYCVLNKNAQYPEGSFICAEHDVPTPGVP